MSQDIRILKNAGLLTESVELKLHIDLPPAIQTIFQAFKSHGKKLYVVGGAVRDSLLGKTPKDFDLATDAIPSSVQQILNDSKIKNFPKGESFGVISAIIDDQEFEIATFRNEAYDDDNGRRPTSVSFSDMAQDVMRRDLTINALYYDITEQKVIDLVGGIEDLKNKRIKSVGNPHERFKEDRLRTIRALRFAHRFGSTLDKETIDAILHFNNLPGVSSERIRAEFISALHSSQQPEEFIKEYIALGLMPRTFPGMNIDTNVVASLRNYCLVVAKLLANNDIGKITKALYESKHIGKEIDTIIFLIKLKNRFIDFDKLVFDPGVDGKWFMSLVKERNLITGYGLIGTHDIISWAHIAKLDIHTITVFSKIDLPFSAKDFTHLKQGAELGKAIEFSNAKNFVEKL